jgi:hypothetical protein
VQRTLAVTRQACSALAVQLQMTAAAVSVASHEDGFAAAAAAVAAAAAAKLLLQEVVLQMGCQLLSSSLHFPHCGSKHIKSFYQSMRWKDRKDP